MEATWIVVANAGRARFFAGSGDIGDNGELEEINDMVNTAVRLRTADTEPDRIGPTSATKSIHNTGGAAPNKSYEPPQTPTEHETELFARSINSFLLQGLHESRFRQLVLVASPQFLGVLRKLLDPQLTPLLKFDINKDYTHLNPRQLREQLQAREQAP
ncbi:host attachment protein [Massilia sp. CCM 9210]|uniref:host attachment protein n=1 Tax=Massilia scottii TaxID=3057166 RepID=UPI0027965DEC|nr:host attachment protein [Massilia sp. CCM 9210]MDQ1816636.1 host attachment protein [Massilia sp. CCM 9210]